jgi:hypothetical protein
MTDFGLSATTFDVLRRHQKTGGRFSSAYVEIVI